MELLYRGGIFLYEMFIRLAARFNEKAVRWLEGRENWQEKLR